MANVARMVFRSWKVRVISASLMLALLPGCPFVDGW